MRAGVRYPFAGGDNVGSSELGPFGAVGVELWRARKVSMGLEVGYDGSSINVQSVKGSSRVTFSGLTAGLFVRF